MHDICNIAKYKMIMKKRFMIKLLVWCFSIIVLINPIYAQEDGIKCKVLIENISEHYEGNCKNGLAHGKGIAKGIDVYSGRFKKGLPNGYGKYIWKNGCYYQGLWVKGKKNGRGLMYDSSTKKETKGIWKDDKFIREIKERPYEIIRQSGITGVSIYERTTATPGSIEIVFLRDGNESKSARDLILDSSSGIQKNSSYFTGFENVIFPFEGYVKFKAPSRFNTVMVDYELRFKINKDSSSWKVSIRY